MSGVPNPETREGLSVDEFKAVFRQHPAGVCVITLADPERLVGFTATSVISVAAEPALLAFSIDSGSSSWPAIERAEHVVVNFLGHHQAELATRFATSGIDRFAGRGWRRLPTGEPVINDSAGWIRARIAGQIPAASSRLVLLEALTARIGGGPPLVYRDRDYHRLLPALRPAGG